MRSTITRWLGILISLILLIFIFYKVDWQELIRAFKNINYIYLAPGIVLYMIGYPVRSWRWQYLLGPIKKIPFNTAFRILVIGFMANNILPARVGEFIRAYLLAKNGSLSKSKTFATIVVERIFDGLVFAIVLMGILIFFSMANWMKRAGICASILFGSVLISLIILAHYKTKTIIVITKIASLLPHWISEKIIHYIGLFLEGLEILKNIKDILVVFIWSLVIWLIEILVYYLVINAFGLNLPFQVAIILMIIVNLGIMVPSAPAYVGIFQGVVLAVLCTFKIEYNLALALSVVLHGIIVIPITILGIIFLFQGEGKRLSIKEVINKL